MHGNESTVQPSARTLEALELLLDQCMTALEEEFRQHLDQHRAKEMETENENVKAAKN